MFTIKLEFIVNYFVDLSTGELVINYHKKKLNAKKNKLMVYIT